MFVLTIIGSAMVGPFIVCNFIPTICHYDSMHYNFLFGTLLINPIAATCSVGWAVVHAEGAAGCFPATHDVCCKAPAQIQECYHLASEGVHSFSILIIASTLT